MKIQVRIVLEGTQEVDSWEEYLTFKANFMNEIADSPDITSVEITERVIDDEEMNDGKP